MVWDGFERRRVTQFDQEVYQKIIETHANVGNLVKNFDAHVEDDKIAQVNTNKALESLKEFKWKSVGIVGAVLVVIDVVMKLVVKSSS